MFKSARWRSERNKVKVVFKLQFHAAKVPHFGDDALMISVVPADAGKPTVKSDKASVRDGSCFWENPVYESVKFIRDQKSGKIQERIYYFVVGTGSSKSGVLGEASIDFANYAEATKVCLVALPLKSSKTDAILNVSIQRMQEPGDQREVEDSDVAKQNYKVNSLKSKLENGDKDETVKSNSDAISSTLTQQDQPLNKTVSHVAELYGTRRASSGSDLTISSSDSSSGVDIPWQPQMNNGSMHQRPQRPNLDAQTEVYEEWLGNSVLEASTDDSSSTPRDTFQRQHLDESSDFVIEKLKSEVAAISRQAEMSELELQTLRKQIVKESKRGQDLFRELVCLREERDVLRGECEKLKAKAKTSSPFEGGDSRAIVEELRQELNHAKELNANLRVQLEKTQESNSELILAVKDLDEMLEQKNREILNLTCGSLSTDIDEKLQGACLTPRPDEEEEQKALEELVKEHGDAKEAYILEQQIMDMRSEIEIYKRDKDELEMQMEQLALDYEIMKQKNHEMAYKLEQSELQEQLKMQYECSSSYAAAHELEVHIENLETELKRHSKVSSDALVKINELESHIKGLEENLEKQSQEFESHVENLENELNRQSEESVDAWVKIKELEANIMGLEEDLEKQSKEYEAHRENLENELKRQSKESLDASSKINELEAHIKGLEEDLEKQSQGFEADLETLMHSKVEQERRAIRAEDSLRKTRWQNSNAAERIQEEFRRLSVQMASTLEANEKLATKALAEANELRLEKIHLEEVIRKATEEHQSMKGHYVDKLQQIDRQVRSMMNQIQGLQSEIEDKRLQLEHQKMHAGETERLLSNEILKLKDEIGTCTAEYKILSEDLLSKEMLMHELDEMRISVKEMEFLVGKGNDERIELEKRIAPVKSDAEEMEKELNKMRSLLEEKELMVRNMQSELDSLQSEYTELKHSLLENELKKEELRKQVVSLKSDLNKTGDVLRSINKMMESSGTEKVANLKERINLLEGQIKLKESALETSSNAFLVKEKDLSNKIEELEARLEVLNQSSTRIWENEVQVAVAENQDTNFGLNAEARSNDEDSTNANSNSIDIPEAQECSRNDSGNFDELMSEMALLKERNKLMEAELKEMQGRYSEISLKFAEVEGERQQLVMKVRNLKNRKKSVQQQV